MTREKCKETAAASTLVYLILKTAALCVPHLDRTLSWLWKLLFLNAFLWILYSYYFDIHSKGKIKG